MPPARRLKASAILMYLAGSLAFIAFATMTDKRVFTEPRQADGFFAQIEVARNFDPVRDRDIESWTFRLFHFFRYIAVYPLIYCDDNEFPAYCQALFICLCILPIACANLPCIDSARKTMVFILPCLISYRATLICCSIAYMFLLLLSRNRSTPLLVASAVFANLSSGTMLSWLMITALCGGQHIRKQRLLLPVACVLVASMVAQGANKAAFFGSRNTVRVDAKIEVVEIAWNAISRSTIIVSIENQHYYRLAVYLLLAGGGGWVIGRLFLEGAASRRQLLFFASAVPGFFVEGLTVIGFCIPLWWYFCGVRLRPDHIGGVGTLDSRIGRSQFVSVHGA